VAAAAVTAQLETQEWNMQEIERIQEEQARLLTRHQPRIRACRSVLRRARSSLGHVPARAVPATTCRRESGASLQSEGYAGHAYTL